MHATIDEAPFARLFASARRPVVWPLLAPGGVAVTRSFPFADVAGEPRDHPHQESLWFAHGDVNGVDFWAGVGRVEAQRLDLDPEGGVARGVARWLDGAGGEVCRDHHAFTFSAAHDWRAVDVDYTLLASNGELVFGDTKEGAFGLRLRPELALRGDGAAGSIRNSEGQRDAEVWGKRARWVAYSSVIDGAPITVAVFDHPDNHGHPTCWHARDYGLLAANPFGLHDFIGAAKGSGELVVPAGGQLRLRYRVWIARGTDKPYTVDAAYARWLAGD